MQLRTAVLFPGQGAQYVGMAADLIERLPAVARLFARGSELTGRDLTAAVKNGPEETLSRTDVSQPAIFLHSMAVLMAIEAQRGAPLQADYTCGLSLGEYSALVFAGAVDMEDALEIVAVRGRCMQAAAEAGKGGMVSLLGLALPQVEDLVAEVRGGEVLAVSNWNAPLQTVVSGEEAALARIEALAPSRGARRVVRLNVAGAFHSPLMAPAAEQLRPCLERLTIQRPRVPFIPNRAGRPVDDPGEIRRLLIEQVTGAVLWAPTVQYLSDARVDRAIEAGPGRVVAGLVKGVTRALEVTPAATWSDAEACAARTR
ncbi:MAG TPA: ACP S-malonyltransferase [Planctomycetota bacterium]|jgi:[acyl-carrier-protein] S-malonyltransferase|nr:ACP S-malonyltransferase [Planctomycetota bacterium]OQC19959.1 MAG: Malonyl CoA-acyl carrier protein transacylase [Planctomycetes bacterium ADurb.Bin069]NMD34405.1 ACP S-malonyltransferase [Planctomycetota bacterium]HNR99504.1 ACP S-malonyltransferase [Planctomycetota bacterium]HNU27379.1 ACP S-malonyltransferase [Planctomycetota bacterium]